MFVHFSFATAQTKEGLNKMAKPALMFELNDEEFEAWVGQMFIRCVDMFRLSLAQQYDQEVPAESLKLMQKTMFWSLRTWAQAQIELLRAIHGDDIPDIMIQCGSDYEEVVNLIRKSGLSIVTGHNITVEIVDTLGPGDKTVKIVGEQDES